jgi:hypothetical protein
MVCIIAILLTLIDRSYILLETFIVQYGVCFVRDRYSGLFPRTNVIINFVVILFSAVVVTHIHIINIVINNFINLW